MRELLPGADGAAQLMCKLEIFLLPRSFQHVHSLLKLETEITKTIKTTGCQIFEAIKLI